MNLNPTARDTILRPGLFTTIDGKKGLGLLGDSKASSGKLSRSSLANRAGQ